MNASTRGYFSAFQRRVRRIPRYFLRLAFRFELWHVIGPNEKSYAPVIVEYLNSRTIREDAVEIGCGLGDILLKLRFKRKVGLDCEVNVLKCANFLAIIGGNKVETVFRHFDFLQTPLEGSFDAIVMVNWTHNISATKLKNRINLMFSENLKSGGEIVIDVVKNHTYQHNHDIGELTSEVDCKIQYLGNFENDREIYSLLKR